MTATLLVFSCIGDTERSEHPLSFTEMVKRNILLSYSSSESPGSSWLDGENQATQGISLFTAQCVRLRRRYLRAVTVRLCAWIAMLCAHSLRLKTCSLLMLVNASMSRLKLACMCNVLSTGNGEICAS